MLHSRALFAVACLASSSRALVDYERAIEHIARVIQDRRGDPFEEAHQLSDD